MRSFLLLMVHHPEVQQKAQAEIDSVVGNARLPNYMDRESLPYLDCVLKEVERFRPITPLGMRVRLDATLERLLISLFSGEEL